MCFAGDYNGLVMSQDDSWLPVADDCGNVMKQVKAQVMSRDGRWLPVADDNGIVMKQVKAQVMCRDDSSGGWLPVAGGGMSNVALICFGTDCDDGTDVSYKITGHRQTDNFVSVQQQLCHLCRNDYLHCRSVLLFGSLWCLPFKNKRLINCSF